MAAVDNDALKADFASGEALDEAAFVNLIDSLNPPPRVITADKIWAVKDEVLQLFKRGLIECPNYQMYSADFSGAEAVQAGWFKRHRYFNITPTANGTYDFVISATNSAGVVVGSATTSLQVVTAVGQPASQTRVLIIGDSLTNSSWPTEFNRLLTGSGGSPAGKGYGNITLIGTQGTPPNSHEGRSGWKWQDYADPDISPFANAGRTALDFGYYVSNNSFVDIDQVYILLGWNSIGNDPKPLASDWASDIGYANTIISAILADFPSAKITLLSLQHPGNAVQAGLRNVYNLQRSVFGHKLAMKEIADGVHSANVDWIDLAAQFDSEYNMPYSNVAVNSRNSVTELTHGDHIHPATPGTYQISDAAYRHFVANWCQ